MSNADVDAFCKLARDCLQLQQANMAKELYEKALAADVDCADAHDGLAVIALMDGDYPTAIDRYLKLTLLQPMEPRHFTNLGAIHNKTGDYTQAAEFLRKAIQKDKRSAEAYFNLGYAQRKLKQWQLAISAYREAARLNPKMAEAHLNMGNVYVEMGNVPMAVIAFKKALEINPDLEKARVALAKAKATVNSASDASNPFGRLVDLHSHQVGTKTSMLRELTDAERYEDRHELRQIADEIERLAKGCLEFLKQTLEPTMVELQRTMAEGSGSHTAFVDVADAYSAATNQWLDQRKALRRKVLELRAHEELVNVPEVIL